MDEDLHDIDDLFRKALGEHHDLPSGAVWDKLDKELDKRKVVSLSRSYNKLKWVAAALFLFSSAIAMYTWKINARISKDRKQETSTGPRRNSAPGRASGNFGATTVKPSLYPEKRDSSASAQPGEKPFTLPPGSADTHIKDQSSTHEKGVVAVKSADSKSGTVSLQKAKLENPLKAGNVSGRNASSERGIVRNEKTNLETALTANERRADNSPDFGKARQQTNAEVPTISANKQKLKTASTVDAKSPDNLAANDTGLKNTGNTFDPRKMKNRAGLPSESQSRIQESNTAVPAKNSVTAELTSRDPQKLATALIVERSTPSVSQASIKRWRPSITTSELPQASAADRKQAIKLMQPHQAGLSLTAFYAVDFLSNKVDNDQHRFREEDRREIKDKEEISNAHTFGLLVNYAINDKLSLQSGLSLSGFTTTIKPKIIFARPDNMGNVDFRFNCSAGYSVVKLRSGPGPASGDSIQALTAKNNLQYLGIPLTLRYHITSGKLSFTPAAGVGLNFLIKSNLETQVASSGTIEKTSSDKIEGLNSSYLNGSLSVGVNYSINHTLALELRPSLRFGLNAINKNAPVKTYLNTYGLAAGLTVKL